jgi:hypothetical protein
MAIFSAPPLLCFFTAKALHYKKRYEKSAMKSGETGIGQCMYNPAARRVSFVSTVPRWFRPE